MQIDTIHNPKEIADLHAVIRRGIRDADPPTIGGRDWQLLTLALRDADGTIRGGLYGATMWGWLLIDALWIDETIRGEPADCPHGHSHFHMSKTLT